MRYGYSLGTTAKRDFFPTTIAHRLLCGTAAACSVVDVLYFCPSSFPFRTLDLILYFRLRRDHREEATTNQRRQAVVAVVVCDPCRLSIVHHLRARAASAT